MPTALDLIEHSMTFLTLSQARVLPSNFAFNIILFVSSLSSEPRSLLCLNCLTHHARLPRGNSISLHIHRLRLPASCLFLDLSPTSLLNVSRAETFRRKRVAGRVIYICRKFDF